MSAPEVTIAIPTRDRADLLKSAVTSALSQTVKDIQVVVVDNGFDATAAIVTEELRDKRVRYVATHGSLDVVGSWNRCISECRTRYLVILGDDDRLDRRFVEYSLLAHRLGPIGFSFTHAHKVDEQWTRLQRWGYNFPPCGFITGDDYLDATLTHECCLTLASTVMMAMAVHERVGGYASPVAKNTFDFNMYLRAAMSFDVHFVCHDLVDYRLHHRQLTEEHWRTAKRPTGKIATYLELIAVLEELLDRRPSAGRPFLLERMRAVRAALGSQLTDIFPDL